MGAPSISSSFGDTKRALPVATRTLRCLAIVDRPLVNWPTTLSLNVRSLSSAMVGLPKSMP